MHVIYISWAYFLVQNFDIVCIFHLSFGVSYNPYNGFCITQFFSLFERWSLIPTSIAQKIFHSLFLQYVV